MYEAYLSCIRGHVDTGQRETKYCFTKHDVERELTPQGVERNR